MAKNTYNPDYTVSPGEILADHMSAELVGKGQLANHLGIPKKTLKNILKGKAPITAEIAIGLGATFSLPAHMWMNLENHYQADIKRLKMTI